MNPRLFYFLASWAILACATVPGQEPVAVPLPPGVQAVWDIARAFHETTATRERISINGLWRFQPADAASGEIPSGGWGYFKVPGCWPGITDYQQKDCQTVFPHPSWKGAKLGDLTAAWYQREISVPREWAARRITLRADCLNSYAAVYLDGKRAGEIRFPGGELDLTANCVPGGKHLLSLLVVSLPLKAVMASFGDSAAPKTVKGTVARRGLCGDVSLESEPAGARIAGVRIETSVERGEILLDARLESAAAEGRYVLRARVSEAGRSLHEFSSAPFRGADLDDGRFTFREPWKPDRLWDLQTPQNQLVLHLSLLDGEGRTLDESLPETFGFRELAIRGRDFYLNGSRLYLSALPLDNAEVGAAWASYDGARESLLRLKSFGINFVYTHNYGCEPGTHLGFTEALRAADDTGVLVSLSQPHFGQYDWKSPDADRRNGYAGHAEHYAGVAGNHPSVVFYSMSHNATGYSEDMDPDQIDGASSPRDSWSRKNAALALRAEAIVHRLDPGRIVYHHSSGNLSSMHNANFYTNFAPIQELDDWFERWATKGTKPAFTCEYMVPCTWDWSMYRGWFRGVREFGSAVVPWDYSIAEWGAQFLGDEAYRIGEPEKVNIRWEAKRFRAGGGWHRWDYPYPIGSKVFASQHAIIGAYLTSNWRAFRTWGLSANSPWEHHFFWSLRDGVDKSRRDFKVDWENLQRPGFSPDFIEDRLERIDLAFERSDWIPTADGQAILRNNRPLLAYIAGGGEAFTAKTHLFTAGESVEKQTIVINNSRERATGDCEWSLALPEPQTGRARVELPTGEQERIPMRFTLPAALPPGEYRLTMTARLKAGGAESETQSDSFSIHVLGDRPAPPPPRETVKAALFDPQGDTRKLLEGMKIHCDPVEAGADLAGYEILVVGRGALTPDGPAPDLARVRQGLRVLVFEQSAAALEKRLGFRVAEYGLRQVFRRVPDHPLLAGLDAEHLRDWRGAATLLPPRLKYELSPRLNQVPVVKWCGLEVSHVWRCGNRGNVASVLIEKPARGDFLPILDGGYSLQYSPLLEYREGKGRIVFCQMDVTGRTEIDPAAARLAENLWRSIAEAPARESTISHQVLLAKGAPSAEAHLRSAGLEVSLYQGGAIPLDQILVVPSGGGKSAAASSPAIAEFLKGGGRLLALGLDAEEANGILRQKVSMKRAEHIAAHFPPAGRASPLAGVGPADVHNRDPREIPLVTGGAEAIGDGVLAISKEASVLFCQLPPYDFISDRPEQYNVRRTFRRASFLLTRLLANLGAAGETPLLERFRSPAGGEEKRWLSGFYLDQPEEWDDPYRFFRW